MYPLKSRDEVGSAFEEYKTFVEKQTGKVIKSVRTDNALEYVGGKFAKTIKSSGIHHQSSVPRCPQQNGISERMNRTLMEMARCLLNDSKLPDNVWVEALQTANYLRNRCESRSLDKITPFEAFWGIKPSVKHLRIFGSSAVALKKGLNPNKLHPKGQECKIVGYSSAQKGYRVMDKRQNIFISRNVRILDEMGDGECVEFHDQSDPEPNPAPKVRVNPPRACKQGSVDSCKRKQSPQKESVAKIKKSYSSSVDETPDIEEDQQEQLQQPAFKIGANVDIKEPDSFMEADSGPWSRFW